MAGVGNDVSGPDASGEHIPVLLQEVLSGLLRENTQPADGVFVDATFGRGGHSRALLDRLSAQSTLVVIDRDATAMQAAADLQAQDPRVLPTRGSFAQLGELLTALNLAQVSGILMDLGVSSPQLDEAHRGFSFQRPGPLDMRMDQSQTMTAASWLNQADETEIADVIFKLGEERHSRRIARQVVAARPLSTTADLVDAVMKAVPKPKRADKHPATRTFQAVRMHVNQELDALQAGLQQAFDALEQGGRLAVISFHSLEDRMVKQTFRSFSQPKALPRRLPVQDQASVMPGRLIGKAIRPSPKEAADNPRARSATLRVIEKRVTEKRVTEPGLQS